MGIEDDIRAGAEAGRREQTEQAEQQEANLRRARREQDKADRRAQFAAELRPLIDRFRQRAEKQRKIEPERWLGYDDRPYPHYVRYEIDGWMVCSRKHDFYAGTSSLIISVDGQLWCQYNSGSLDGALFLAPWELGGANKHVPHTRDWFIAAEEEMPFGLGRLAACMDIEI